MQPINLDRSLIEYKVILGIENIVAVPVHSCQKLWEHKEEHADFLIHGKHGLPSVHIIHYPKYIPLVAAVSQYKQHIVNKGSGKKPILAKSDGYPMQIVQLETTINKLEMKCGDYFHAFTPNSLGSAQRDAQGGPRRTGRL